MDTQTDVITYQLAYLTHQPAVQLCAPCHARDDHGLGTLGSVQHGQHVGYCDSPTHQGAEEDARDA